MHFPKADDQQQADNCLLMARGDDISPHWLVYEVARDFLSVPRTFAVVAIYSDYEFEWHEAGVMTENEQGITQLKAEPDPSSDPEQPSDLDCWRITLPRMKLDVWGSLQLKTTLYGTASATEALIRVLSADALGAGSVFSGEK